MLSSLETFNNNSHSNEHLGTGRLCKIVDGNVVVVADPGGGGYGPGGDAAGARHGLRPRPRPRHGGDPPAGQAPRSRRP